MIEKYLTICKITEINYDQSGSDIYQVGELFLGNNLSKLKT